MAKPGDGLREAADVIDQREVQYGSNYKRTGRVMKALFPNGIVLGTEEDFVRFSLLLWIVAKTGRYAHNFDEGGHADSLTDIAGYASLLGFQDKSGKQNGPSTQS